MTAPRQASTVIRPARVWAGPRPDETGAPPPEFVHSLLSARRGVGLPPAQLRDLAANGLPGFSQGLALAGNRAVAEALRPDGAERKPAAPTETPEAASPDEKPKDPAAPPLTNAPAQSLPPGVQSAGGAPGATPPAESGPATPDAVQARARQTAQSLPGPRQAGEPQSPGPEDASAAPRRANVRRQAPGVTGVPPAPVVKPTYAAVTDPIPEATKRIEEASNRPLADQLLPELKVTPGGHMPDMTQEPLTRAQQRLILRGEPGMKDAKIDDKERARLLAIRATLLAPMPANIPGAPKPEPVIPLPWKVTARPLPPAEITVAEQELFTGVLARLLADTDEKSKDIIRTVKLQMKDYPNSILIGDRIPDFAATLQAPIAGRIQGQAQSLAKAMGVAGGVLDQAIAYRREDLAQEQKDKADGLKLTAEQLSERAKTNAEARLAAAAQAKAAALEAKRRAKSTGRAPKPGFRELAEAAIARIQDKVGMAVARYQLSEKERSADLDKAKARQISAYQTAMIADELASAAASPQPSGEAANSNPFTARAERRKAQAATTANRKWVEDRTKELDEAVKRLQAETKAAIAANITAVQTEGANAFIDLKAWGATHEGATEAWWQDSVRNLDSWAARAQDTANTWASAQTHLARLELQRDLERVREQVDQQLAADEQNGKVYLKATAERKKAFVNSVLAAPGQTFAHDTLTATFLQRQIETEQKGVEDAVDTEIKALPKEQWETVDLLANAGNPGFHAKEKATSIYSSGEDKIGTDEDAIFAALSGLRPIELQAVTLCYECRHGAGSLRRHLRSELGGSEWERAESLLTGDKVEIAVAQIYDAVDGAGTKEKLIMSTLRGLTDEQRAEVAKRYEAKHHESLDAALSGDMEDSELAQARALAAGRIDEADAFELDQSLRPSLWSGTGDREGVTAVYDRVRQETHARAQAEHWTAEEMEAEITSRNQAIEARFGEKLGNEVRYRGRGQSTLRNAITHGFAYRPGERDLANALADNDMVAADGALLQAEREGAYADDDIMKGVVRKQLERAQQRVLLDRGPELSAGIDATIRAETEAKTKAGQPVTTRWQMDRRAELQREMDHTVADDAFERAKGTSKALDSLLKANYQIDLDTMIAQNMSGGDRREAQAQMEVLRRNVDPNNAAQLEDRRLQWAYNRVRYAIEGVGTDMDELKGGLAGLTKDEMDKVDAKWRKDHNKQPLVDAVKGDTSGREEDDLVDTVKNGAPETVKARMEAERRKAKRDNEGVGAWGRYHSEDEAAETERALQRMEALNKDLDNPNLSPEKRAALGVEVNQKIANAGFAIEAQRAAVDSFADNVSTIFSYVLGAIAIVVGAVVGFLSGGTAVPALIAIGGSLLGTLGGMAIKASIKGSAYGIEEVATDAAVGAVDLIVTMATLGAFKGAAFIQAVKAGFKTMAAASWRLALPRAARAVVGLTAREAVTDAAKQAAKRSAVARLADRAIPAVKKFAVDQAHQFTTALPTALTANLMNERNLRNGNPLKNVAGGTWDMAVENLQMGLGMAAFGHVVNKAVAHTLVVTHPPMSHAQMRAQELRSWREANPDKPLSEFVAQRDAQQAASARNAEEARVALRDARRELLGEMPPSARKAIADVPIVRVSEGEFKSLNHGRPGDALVWVRDGQAALVIREGAPAGSVARHAVELTKIVAPESGGRTKVAADSLPPHLRNRVKVVPDAGVGLDGVKAVPVRDKAGRIIGVELKVGPQATSAKIKGHVHTLESIRELTGLLGKARTAARHAAMRVGFDVVSPLERGRWEAAGELAKLPALIEHEIKLLAEAGPDPRRRGIIEDRISSLRNQLQNAHARFAMGADAPSVGYIAAEATKGTKKPRQKPTRTPREKTAPGQTVTYIAPGPDVPPATAAEHMRSVEIVKEIIGLEASVESRATAIGQDVLPSKTTQKINEQAFKFKENLKSIQSALPLEIRDAIGQLNAQPTPIQLRDLSVLLVASPEFLAARQKFGAQDARRVDTMMKHLEAFREQTNRRIAADDVVQVARARIAALRQEYGGLKGRIFHGEPLHPDLPPPRNLTYEVNTSTVESQEIHKRAMVTEVRLANRIATEGHERVLEYGHGLTEHGADLVTFNPSTDEVTLWDAKSHKAVKGSGDSDTFTDPKTRKEAAERAAKYIRENDVKLTPEQKARVLADLEAGNFKTVTTHTTGGKFSDRQPLYFANHQPVSK